MNALNIPVEFPTTALPTWANRWAYDYTTNEVIPVRFTNGLVWLCSPNEPGSLPQVPTGLVLLDDPYRPIEVFMWVTSAACLVTAFVINVMGRI